MRAHFPIGLLLLSCAPLHANERLVAEAASPNGRDANATLMDRCRATMEACHHDRAIHSAM